MILGAVENASTLIAYEGNISQIEEDPRILAATYMMYKVGKYQHSL